MKISDLPMLKSMALWDRSTDHYVRWTVFNLWSTLPWTVWSEGQRRFMVVKTAMDKINENL